MKKGKANLSPYLPFEDSPPKYPTCCCKDGHRSLINIARPTPQLLLQFPVSQTIKCCFMGSYGCVDRDLVN